MVLLFDKIFHSLKLPSKLENHHHHHQSEALSASLQAFRSEVSNSVNQLSRNSKPGSEFLSLSWIHQCLELIPSLNRAFAKLVVEIDYPMSQWEIPCMEEYLSYTLKLLDHLNSISSSLSHLSQVRVSISHALTLIETSHTSAIERLRGIQFRNQSKELVNLEEKEEGDEERNWCGKELVFHEAMMDMRKIGLWVCEIVLFGLAGDLKPHLEMKTAGSGLPVSSVMALDLNFREENGVPEELREVNEAVACLVEAIGDEGRSGGAAKELERRLEVVEKLLDGIGKEANGIFCEVLEGRNEVLDVLRQRKE